MADVLADIFEGLRDYFKDNLTAEDVIVGFPDERGDEPVDRVYPLVSITLIGAISETGRKYGGMTHTRQDNEAETIATMTPTPIPVGLQFQLDAFSEKRRADWTLTQEILAIIESHPVIETPAARLLYPSLISFDTLDALEDGLFRKAYRFAITAWLDSPLDAEDVYLVLETKLHLQGQEILVPSEEEGV